MSEIARREEPAALDNLAQFADVARATHIVAQSLAGTSFVPSSMKNKPDEVTGCILAGAELNLKPMAALASIDLIEGRPSIRANTMRGLLLAAGGEIEVMDANDTRVIMRARLSPSRAWQEVTWTMDRARKMGLDGKSNWKKMPQAMLVARATSELVRLVAAHLLIGMPYSSEELADEPMQDERAANGTTPPRNERRTAQRAPVKATVAPFAEPEVEPDQADQNVGEFLRGETREIEAPKPVGEPITDTTRKAIMAGFNEIGVKVRDTRLKDVSIVVGREVPSVNVLTEYEGRKVVAYLQEIRTTRANAADAGPGEKASDFDWPEVAGSGR